MILMRLALVGLYAVVGPLGAADNVDERTRLAAERQALTQRFDQEEQACGLRFATTDCLSEVRAHRREALAPLRERELALADADRQQRAAERRRAVAAKQQAAAARTAAGPPALASAPQVQPPQVPLPPAADLARVPAPDRADREADRKAQAARRARANALRQAEIDADKKRVAERVASRAAAGQQPQALPPLPAASARAASPLQP